MTRASEVVMGKQSVLRNVLCKALVASADNAVVVDIQEAELELRNKITDFVESYCT